MGRIRLIFVADTIPPELKRIVEFLSRQMRPAEVLAVEVKQYTGQGQRALVPRLVAGAKPTLPQRESVTWDLHRLELEFAKRRGPILTAVVNSIVEWATSRSLALDFGRGREYGSFYPTLSLPSGKLRLFGPSTDGNIWFLFAKMREVPPFDREDTQRELLQRLNQIQGVTIPADCFKPHKWTRVKLSVLTEPATLEQFLAVFDWVVDEIRRHEGAAAQSER